MWVDQPAGVGFSTGIGTHDEKGVAENMYVPVGCQQSVPRISGSLQGSIRVRYLNPLKSADGLHDQTNSSSAVKTVPPNLGMVTCSPCPEVLAKVLPAVPTVPEDQLLCIRRVLCRSNHSTLRAASRSLWYSVPILGHYVPAISHRIWSGNKAQTINSNSLN